MIAWFAAAVLGAYAASGNSTMVKSDCTPAELKVLRTPAIVAQFVTKGRVVNEDCTPVVISPERSVLAVVQVFNTPTGYESYLSIFERKGFAETSAATFKSSMLGFDLFPMLVENNHRLIFIHPASDKTKVVLFLNVQISPNSSRLTRFELALEKFNLTETPGRGWPIEAGVLPKIYDDGGLMRALMESRAVEL